MKMHAIFLAITLCASSAQLMPHAFINFTKPLFTHSLLKHATPQKQPPAAPLATVVHYKTIFAHGIVDGPSQMHRFLPAIATQEKIAVMFPDAQIADDVDFNTILSKLVGLFSDKNINRNNMYMAQKEDIETLKKLINLSIAQPPKNNTKIILYGCSRGAATIINYMAQYNQSDIAALMLDASPASMHEAIQPQLIRMGLNPARALSLFTWLFPNYPEHPLTPLESIKTIHNKDSPILLIHSLDDEIVPYPHALMLYQEFKNQGFKNIHLCSIQKGRHSFLLQDEQAHDPYLQTVHSFYKKYDLPHDPCFAKLDLNNSQIDPQILTQRINTYKEFIKHAQG